MLTKSTPMPKCNDKAGIGITDLRSKNYSIGINNRIQIYNAELVAILKAIMVEIETEHREVVILTDSEEQCRGLLNGDAENYLVHEIE